MTLVQKSPISRTKAEYESCATWAIPRGVSSHHVLVRAFGDALYRREDVRHATLLFLRQECQRARERRGEKRTLNEEKCMEIDCE